MSELPTYNIFGAFRFKSKNQLHFFCITVYPAHSCIGKRMSRNWQKLRKRELAGTMGT